MPAPIGLANEEAKAGLNLREAIDLYREQVEQEEFVEFEECDFFASFRIIAVHISRPLICSLAMFLFSPSRMPTSSSAHPKSSEVIRLSHCPGVRMIISEQ